MKRLLVHAGCALAMLLASAPAAQATPDYHWRGGCGMTFANDSSPGSFAGGPTTWTGEVDIVALATTENFGTPAPTAFISVLCTLWINAQGYPLLSASGLGLAVDAAAPLTFTIGPNDVVSLCERVFVQTDTHTTCYTPSTVQPVPQPVMDVATDTLVFLDPWMCPFIGAGAPGIPGVVDITPQGDVRVLGNPVYDCPVYNTNPKLWTQQVMVVRHF